MELFRFQEMLLRTGTGVLAIIFVLGSMPGIAGSCAHEFFRPYYKTRSEFCAAGEIVTDFYTGKPISCEEAEVDHVVSLREAYLAGVCGDDLKKLARDPDNLRLTHWEVNRRKGAMPVENFIAQSQVSKESQARTAAQKIRARYGVMNEEDAFSIQVVNRFARSARATPVVSIAAARSMKGVVEKQVGKRILFFSGKRLIGYSIGVGLAADTIILVPEGFNFLGRALSTDVEVRRADYIKELLR